MDEYSKNIEAVKGSVDKFLSDLSRLSACADALQKFYFDSIKVNRELVHCTIRSGYSFGLVPHANQKQNLMDILVHHNQVLTWLEEGASKGGKLYNGELVRFLLQAKGTNQYSYLALTLQLERKSKITGALEPITVLSEDLGDFKFQLKALVSYKAVDAMQLVPQYCDPKLSELNKLQQFLDVYLNFLNRFTEIAADLKADADAIHSQISGLGHEDLKSLYSQFLAHRRFRVELKDNSGLVGTVNVSVIPTQDAGSENQIYLLYLYIARNMGYFGDSASFYGRVLEDFMRSATYALDALKEQFRKLCGDRFSLNLNFYLVYSLNSLGYLQKRLSGSSGSAYVVADTDPGFRNLRMFISLNNFLDLEDVERQEQLAATITHELGHLIDQGINKSAKAEANLPVAQARLLKALNLIRIEGYADFTEALGSSDPANKLGENVVKYLCKRHIRNLENFMLVAKHDAYPYLVGSYMFRTLFFKEIKDRFGKRYDPLSPKDVRTVYSNPDYVELAKARLSAYDSIDGLTLIRLSLDATSKSGLRCLPMFTPELLDKFYEVMKEAR